MSPRNYRGNESFSGEVTGLTVGREFFKDQDNVVSATRICRGGASASGVKKSDGEVTVKVALWVSGDEENTEVDTPGSSFSRTTSIKRRFP